MVRSNIWFFFVMLHLCMPEASHSYQGLLWAHNFILQSKHNPAFVCNVKLNGLLYGSHSLLFTSYSYRCVDCFGPPITQYRANLWLNLICFSVAVTLRQADKGDLLVSYSVRLLTVGQRKVQANLTNLLVLKDVYTPTEIRSSFTQLL